MNLLLKHLPLVSRLLLLFLYLFTSSWSGAQITQIDKTQLVVPFVDNYRTIIDRDNIVWVLSEKGLTRFNFNHSKTFKIADGLPTNDIWHMYPDKQNRKWLFHRDKGIYYIQNDEVHLVPGTENIQETFIIGEINDTLFFRTFGYFSIKKFGKTYCYTDKGGFHELDSTKTNFRQRNGTILLNEQKLSWDMRSGILKTFTDQSGDSYSNFSTGYRYGYVQNEGDPKLLFGNFSNPPGELQLISNKWTGKKQLQEVVGSPVSGYRFIEGSTSCIVETNDSLFFYENILTGERNRNIERVLYTFYDENGLNFDFNRDQEDNLWITIHRGGVYYIPKSYYTIHELNTGTLTKSQTKGINCAFLGVIGSDLYILTRDFRILRRSATSGTFELIGTSPDTKDIRIHENYLVWSNQMGVHVYNAQTGETQSFGNGDRIVSFDFLNPNLIYTNNGLKISLLDSKVSTQNTFNGPINHLISTDDVVFIIENNHLIIYDKKALTPISSYEQKNVLDIEHISSEYVGSFIENNGVVVYSDKGKRIGHFFQGNSVVSAFCYGDFLFAVSDDDILYIKKNKAAGFSAEQKKYRTFLKKINLSIQTATVVDENIVIGTNKGLFTYPIDAILSSVSTPPSLFYKNMMVSGKPVTTVHNFKHNDNNFSFFFDAYAYGNHGETRLKYRLKGLEDSWSYTTEHTIIYKTLPPGKYVLQVIAIAGEHSERIDVPFSVCAPFWQTWYFIAVVIALMGLLITLVFRRILNYRARKHRQRNMLMELEFKALKTQLNPHFIFNSLNSLQTVLHRKSEREANEYIVSFSRLMRTVLDNSRMFTVSLTDELEFLKNFIFLSAQKINDPILFNVDLGNVHHPSNIYIRNMILQPIVENSVLHGLANKHGTKRITIALEQSNGLLKVVITDNGIGRKAASEINQLRTKNHTSVSTTILKEKSRLLHEMKLEELDISIEDLYQNDEPAGTQVTVVMKIFDHNSA